VLGRRAGAWFIDVVLCGLAAAVPALVLGDAYALDRAGDGLSFEWHDGDAGIFVRDTVIVLRQWELLVIAGAALLAVLVVFVAVPGRRGSSPGKLAADLRVVNADGNRPGLFRALVRTLCWVVDILPGIPLVAYGVAGQSRRHQRIGDHLARTYVVDKHAIGLPVGAPIELDDPFADQPVVVEDATLGSDPDQGDELAGPVDATSPGAASPAPDEAETEVPAAGGSAPALATPPEGVPVDEPIWDRRHRRYVMWHGRSGRWLEHAEDGWRPLGH
jgi:uncharacterized RDD family membrane protein YckC